MKSHPRWMAHSKNFWQNVAHWRRERKTTPVFLLQELHEQHKEARRYSNGIWGPQVRRCPIRHWEGWRAITNCSKRMKRLCQSGTMLSCGCVWWWKVRFCKAQYCIGTWKVRSMNQGKLDLVMQEIARVYISILGISELKWTGMCKFNSDAHYIYYCRQESLRRNGVACIVKKRVWNALLGCSLRNNRIISVCFQGKPFNITVIQSKAQPMKLKDL